MYKKLKKKEAAMPNLPEEMLLEIFVRLPMKSLSRFKCVSKSLGTVIASSDFTNMHLDNMKSNPGIIFASKISSTMYSIDYRSLSSLLPLSKSSTVRSCDEFTNRMDYPMIPEYRVQDFLCSCDGWLCIRFRRHGVAIYLWNPLTKESKKIPYSQYADRVTDCVYGLGYDYKIDNYKLVRIMLKDWSSNYSEVHVHRLGSDSWISKQSMPYRFMFDAPNDGVLLNRAIHWLARTNIGGQHTRVLVSFDIVNEILKEVALPDEPIPHPNECLENKKFSINVGTLKEQLCLILIVFNVRIDVWVMRDYGVRESWTKSLTITGKKIIRSPNLKLIWSFKNNEILLWFHGGFILYDPKKKRYRRLIANEFEKGNIVAGNYVANGYQSFA